MRNAGWKFYTHVSRDGSARLMCSWDTTIEDVDAFASTLRGLVAGLSGRA